MKVTAIQFIHFEFYNSLLLTTALLLATLLCLLTPSLLQAQNPLQQSCLKEANQDWKEAQKQANFELRSAKNSCRYGPEIGACMMECLPGLKLCLQPVYDSLKDCRSSCGQNLFAARRAAKDRLNCGDSCNSNAEFQKAAVEANLNYQSCRITCRSSAASISTRAACRSVHGSCVNACKS